MFIKASSEGLVEATLPLDITIISLENIAGLNFPPFFDGVTLCTFKLINNELGDYEDLSEPCTLPKIVDLENESVEAFFFNLPEYLTYSYLVYEQQFIVNIDFDGF